MPLPSLLIVALGIMIALIFWGLFVYLVAKKKTQLPVIVWIFLWTGCFTLFSLVFLEVSNGFGIKQASDFDTLVNRLGQRKANWALTTFFLLETVGIIMVFLVPTFVARRIWVWQKKRQEISQPQASGVPAQKKKRLPRGRPMR